MKRRTALAASALATAALSLTLYSREDLREPSRLDERNALFELSLATPPSELVTTTESREVLLAQVRAVRERCAECSVLGVNPESALFEAAPALRQRLTQQEIASISGAWTRPFLRYADVGGAARALVHQYLLVLDRHGLTRKNPHGARAPLPPPDRKRLKACVSNSGTWGLPLALAVALLAFAGLPNVLREGDKP